MYAQHDQRHAVHVHVYVHVCDHILENQPCRANFHFELCSKISNQPKVSLFLDAGMTGNKVVATLSRPDFNGTIFTG